MSNERPFNLLNDPIDTPEARKEFGEKLGEIAGEAFRAPPDPAAVEALVREHVPSDTPRSDAATIVADGGGAYVEAEVAKQIERELTAARNALNARIQPIEFTDEDFFIVSAQGRVSQEDAHQILRQFSNTFRVKISRFVFIGDGLRLEIARRKP